MQLCHVGSPAEDLLRFTFASQSPEDRREYKDDLMEEMFEAMKEQLEGAPPPYTLQDVL